MTGKKLLRLAAGFLMSAALFVGGCGSDSNPTGTVAVTADKTSPVATGTTVTLTATAKDAAGVTVPNGTVITFSTTAGTLSATTATTTGGTASVTLTSSTTTTAIVTASSAVGGAGQISMSFQNPNDVKTVALAADKTSAAITTNITFTATVTTVSDAPAPDGTAVTFATTAGTLSSTTATTTNGTASVTLTSATATAASVTATAGGKSSTAVNVSFSDPNAIGTVTLAADKTTAGTGQNFTFTATVQTVSNTPAPNGTTVNFSTTGGTLSATSATTTNGTASVTLSSATVGSASVTASAGGKTSAPVTVSIIAQPTKAVVKLSTSGTLPAGVLIGAISATVNYPTTKGLSITAANVVKSGVATGSIMTPNANTAGQVIVGVLDTTGIPVGEFATLTFTIAPGNFPSASDFTIAPGVLIGSNALPSAPLTGITVVPSVTFQ